MPFETSSNKAFFQTGGALRLDARSYVERHADARVFDVVLTGEFCYILDTRQVGKTSLLARVSERLRAAGRRVAVLDLTSVGRNVTVEEWYAGLLEQFVESPEELERLADFWGSRGGQALGPCQRWFAAIKNVVLDGDTRPIVVVVDEIDFVRSLPFSASEFFAAVRACYSRRSQDPTFDRLTFLLAGAATPAQLIEDDRVTPFNIGQRIELTDFTPQEARCLIDGLVPSAGGSASKAQHLLDRILYWTAGHPYLTQRLCRSLTESVEGDKPPDQREITPSRSLTSHDVDQVCTRIFLSREARENDENLTFVRNRLLSVESGVDASALLILYGRVLRNRLVPYFQTDPLIAALRLAGVVSVSSGRLRARNRIYRRAFDGRWIAQSLPGEEVRRQRRAFRLGLIRASLFWFGAAAVVLLVSWLTGRASRESARADRATHANAQAVAEVRKLASDVAASRGNLASLEGQRRHVEAHLEKLAAEEKRTARQAIDARRNLAAAKRQAADAQIRLLRTMAQEASVEAQAQASERVAQGHVAEARQRLLAASRRLDSVNGQWASALSLQPGREFEALEYGLKAVEPALNKGISPDPEALQGLVDAVDTGVVRRFRVPTATPVTSIAISADGTHTLVGTKGTEAYLIDSVTGQSYGGVSTNDNRISLSNLDSADFADDARLLLTGSDQPEDSAEGAEPKAVGRLIRFWDLLETMPAGITWHRSPKRQLFLPEATRALALFAPKTGDTNKPALKTRSEVPQYIVTSSVLEDVLVWDTTSILQAPIKSGSISPRTAPIAPIVLSPVPAVPSGRDPNPMLTALALSPSGKRIAVAGRYSGVRLYNLPSELVLYSPTTHGQDGQVTAVSFLDDDTLVYSAGQNDIHLWKVGEDPPVTFEHSHSNPVPAIDTWPERNLIMSGGSDGATCVWTAQPEHQPLFRWKTNSSGIGGLKFNRERGELVAGGLDDAVETWMFTIPLFAQRSGDVRAAVWGRKGKWFASGGSNGQIDLWNRAAKPSEARLGCILTHGPVNALAFCSQSDLLAVAISGQRRPVQIWDVHDPAHPSLKRELVAGRVADRDNTADLYSPNDLDFSPDGKTLVVGWREGTDVWDVASGEPVPTDNYVWSGSRFSVRYSPDGDHIYLSGTDGLVRRWSRKAGKIVQEYMPRMRAFVVGTNAFPNDADESPGRRFLATADNDGRLYLWSITGSSTKPGLDPCLGAFIGHHGPVLSLRFSPDGKTIATAGADGMIRLWDVALLLRLCRPDGTADPYRPVDDTKTHPLVISAHQDKVFTVRWSPDGQSILTSSADGTARIFPATLSEYVRRAHEILTLRMPYSAGIGPPPPNGIP